MKATKQKFDDFRALHHDLFVIAPTWDVISAVVLHQAGYKAIATSSVGLGFANGITSEEVISFDEMVEIASRICAAVDIAVSIDMETGYAETDEGLAENVRRLIDAGVVGLNLEDNSDKPGSALVDAQAHAHRIDVIRRTANAEDVSLFINARTDGFWIKDEVAAEEKAAEAVRRGNDYLAAGADGVFVSGPKIPESVIAPMAHGIEGPLNLLMQPDWPGLPELRSRGLRRLSLGSWHTRALFGFMSDVVRGVADNDFSRLREFAVPTPAVDKAILAARPGN